MATTSSAGGAAANQRLMEQLVQLTEAVKHLAESPAGRSTPVDTSTEADRARQRVTFGYRALGALTGRVSSRSGSEFDVHVVAATRRKDLILFEALPPAADWVELRTGTKVEVLRIHRDDDRDDDKPGGAGHERRRTGVAKPRHFDADDPIGSMVFLRSRQGPVLAFGPRLDPGRSGRPSTTDDTIDLARSEGAGHVSEPR